MCRQPGSTGVGMVAYFRTYPPWYEARFIVMLDQCYIAGAVRTYKGCQRRIVVDFINCLCSKHARFQVRRACHALFVKSSQLLLPLPSYLIYHNHSSVAHGYQLAKSMQSANNFFLEHICVHHVAYIHTGKEASWILTCQMHSLDLRAGFMTGIYRCQQSLR